MTLLQSKLGPNYRWFYITRFALLSETGSKWSFIAKYISTIITVVATAYIWKLASNNEEATLFTYILFGKIYYDLTSNNYFFRLGLMIFSGKINKILFPINFGAFQYFESIGTRITKNLFGVGGTIIGVIICAFKLPIAFDWHKLIFLVPMFIITFTICQFLGVIIGTASFWARKFAEADGFQQTAGAIYLLLSGSLIPPFKLPTEYSKIIELLPFSYMLHHPMQILTGQYDSTKILITYGGGITWCLVLWIVSRMVFKLGLKKNESVGL